MAKKEFVDSRSEELNALTEIDGVDAQKILSQAGIETPAVETPPGETPPEETPPETPPADTPPGDTPPATPASPPPVGTTPVVETPPAGTPPVDVDQLRADFVKEIFGDQFKTVDDLKQANVTGQLQELATLREGKIALEAKLEAKPKTSFVNDDIALFNEFVKETGNSDFGIFKTINSTDIANMDPMDALVKQEVLKNPHFAGQEDHLKKFFEKKYNLDPENVDESELAINKVGLQRDGEEAKKKLLEVKSKLKMPEPPEEIPPAEGPKELTAEEKQTLTTSWDKVATEVGKGLGSLSIHMKDSKEPIMSYEIDGELQKVAVQGAVTYCVQNRMELNEGNVKRVAEIMRNQMVINELPNIVHSVFEKARSLTKEEVTKLYDNPSPAKNTDTPPTPPVPTKTPDEEKRDAAFDLEMGIK